MSENKNHKKHQPWELEQMQSCPLRIKESMSERRIIDWYSEFWDVYVSFSGGKDSTVLSDLVARVCQRFGYRMVMLFSDTGLEYPEIREFVPQYVEFLKRRYDIEIELVVVKPEMTFKKVIETVGYPIGSKKLQE